MAAIRSLERTRRNFGAAMLNESRERLSMIPSLAAKAHASADHSSPNGQGEAHSVRAKPQNALSPPPPIAEVLRDVYEEEKKTA
jgi:hypothetical protein